MPIPQPARLILIGLFLATCGGCATTRSLYYDTWEKLGYAKRERLVNNVKSARDEQQNAKQQFASALDQFKSVVNVPSSDLEATYNKLNKQYEACDSEASAVRSKIDSVKHVGQALFDEWQGEVKEIKDDPSLQQKSQQLYDQTKQNYTELIARMDTAAASMDPVLTRFKNRVLVLKGNLNAQVIGSIKGTEGDLNDQIDKLIKEMEASIAQADQFIAQIEPKK